jgi:hypothetical protein
MKLQNYIVPVFVCTNLLAQTEAGSFPKMSFGFTHSTYTSLSFSSMSVKPLFKKENESETTKPAPFRVTEIQYGFGIGVFLWMPLSDYVVFKPKIEGNFTNTCLKHAGSVYATSFDISISHGFAVALDVPNTNGTIHVAKDMSCYLTSKQPYLLIGPKISLKKFDTGYLQKGYQNELNFGAFIGYGINFEFHGTNYAPEISYAISTTGQNEYNGSKKVAHTITLALNFF